MVSSGTKRWYIPLHGGRGQNDTDHDNSIIMIKKPSMVAVMMIVMEVPTTNQDGTYPTVPGKGNEVAGETVHTDEFVLGVLHVDGHT